MSTNHHTPVSNGAAANAATINGPLSQLDTKITSQETAILLRSKVWAGKTAAPTVNDDSGDGYAIGDRWVDETNNKEYVIVDTTVGAAVWLETTIPASSSGGDVIRTKYIITPSVTSSNLTVALKYIDGGDPTATNKLTFRVGNTEYDLTAAMSFTKNAATNWCNLGSTEAAALPHDLFFYAIGETGASAGLKFGFSRIPYAQAMADFVNTSTSEKYIAGNWTNFNATDAVTVIGRFEATLSAGAGYTWSVPTYTNSNLINSPIYETRSLSWTPVFTGFSVSPTVAAALYTIKGKQLFMLINTSSGTSNANTFTVSLPITASAVSGDITKAPIQYSDNGAQGTTPGLASISAGATTVSLFKDWSGAVWTTSGTKNANFSFSYNL